MASVSRRALRAALLAIAALGSALLLGCGGAEPEPGPQVVAQQAVQEEDQQSSEPGQGDAESSDGYTLVIPNEVVGLHLVPTDIHVPVDLLLAASEDPVLAAWPARTRASVGTLFQPSEDSPTEESFWLHVFTDQTSEAAIEWVDYLAAQPPTLAGFLVPHHDVFEARFRPPPEVGDTGAAIVLLHGHRGGCWRSELVVFAQDRRVVLLRNTFEITTDEIGAASAGSAAGELCDETKSARQLTDLDAIAQFISEQLASAS